MSLHANGTKRFTPKVREGVGNCLGATTHDKEKPANKAADFIHYLLVLLQDQELDLSRPIGRLRESRGPLIADG